MTYRSIERVITGRPTSDGGGVRLTRVVSPEQGLDPFLLLDEFDSSDAGDYIAGFPAHPHRGFETVTYMLDGHMLHEDHLGHRGDLKPGGVQWMTAGRGIIHSEMPQQVAGRMRGFQLWINLPGAEKMKPAAYQDLEPDRIPSVVGRGATVRVVAGRPSSGSSRQLPATTRTVAPRSTTLGMRSGSRSRYAAGFIFSTPGRLIHSWKPRIRPAICCGISEWMMPRPAVIHCTPPGLRSPRWPRWSSCSMWPSSM